MSLERKRIRCRASREAAALAMQRKKAQNSAAAAEQRLKSRNETGARVAEHERTTGSTRGLFARNNDIL